MIGFALIPIFVKFFLDPNSINIYLFKYIPDLSYQLDNKQLLITAALLIVFYFILKNFIHFIFINHKGSYVKNFITDLKKDIIKNFIFKPYEFFLTQNTGFLLKNITTDVEKVRYAVVEVITILKEILLIIMLFGLSLFTSPVVTLLVTLVFLIISITFYLLLKKTIKKKGTSLQFMEGIEIKNLLDYFNTIKIIKILEKENFFLKNYKNNLKEIEENKKFFLLINSTPRIIFETLAIISVISVSIFFIIQGSTSNQVLPTIALLIFVAIRLLPSYNTIASSISSIKYNSKSIFIIIDIIYNLKKEKVFEKKNISNFKLLFNNDIRISNLTFSFDNKQIISIKDLTICKNKITGLIGKSGSGKSTFLNILSTMLEPQSGSIKIGKKNIFDNIQDWRKIIGYVPQDTILIDDTIAKNIAFGIEEHLINFKKIEELVEKLDMQDFILNSNNGINTLVGDKGLKISGGQKQRIGLARALYPDPQFLILDESTSSLDLKTEKKILNILYDLAKNQITVLLSTHRTTNLDVCDILYNLENGDVQKIDL